MQFARFGYKGANEWAGTSASKVKLTRKCAFTWPGVNFQETSSYIQVYATEAYGFQRLYVIGCNYSGYNSFLIQYIKEGSVDSVLGKGSKASREYSDLLLVGP